MLTIRRLLPATDVRAFREVRLRALRQAPEAFGSTYDAEASQPDEQFERRLTGAAVWGAFAEARCIGMAGLLRQQPPKMAHKSVLWGMFVDADMRGRRVGARLADAAIEQARADGVEIVQLSCVTTNTAAHRLYESRGFVVYGTERCALKVDGTCHDEFLMALDLRAQLDSTADSSSRASRLRSDLASALGLFDVSGN